MDDKFCLVKITEYNLIIILQFIKSTQEEIIKIIKSVKEVGGAGI